ncbi:MAG: pilus assembly protein TadE [Clostridiaceae bacterium]|nr:pilus assembly protein TadE [Clostridiaceae bacterium]
MDNLSNPIKNRKGALTVEAAIVMPLFICVILSFALFIKIVYTQSVVQHAINETANELSVYSYLYSVSGAQKLHDDAKDYLKDKSKLAQEQINSTVDALGTLGNTKKSIEEASESLKNADIEKLTKDIEDIKNLSEENIANGKALKEKLDAAVKNPKQQIISFASLLAQGAFEDSKGALVSPLIRVMCKKHIESDELNADERLKRLGVVNGLSGLDFSETRILYDKENIDIIVRYKVESGLPINYLPELYFIQRANVRAWLDGDGKTLNAVEEEPASTNLWELSVRKRTNKIFEEEGKETPENIAITNYNGGDIIDVTSINLSEKSYVKTSVVKSRINSSIRKLSDFENKNYTNIKSRTLIVIIPENSLEVREDVKKLLTDDCLKYAQERNVILKYREGYGVLPESND